MQQDSEEEIEAVIEDELVQMGCSHLAGMPLERVIEFKIEF
jgi:hypothetical protein